MTTSIAQEYIDRFDGDVVRAGEVFAHDLMRGDPVTFKAGYEAESALLVVKEQFDLTDNQWLFIRSRVMDVV